MRITILIVVGIILVAFMFLNFYPAFGGKASKEKVLIFNQSKSYLKGKFVNQIPTTMDTSFKKMVSILKDYLKGNPKIRPVKSIPVQPLDARLLEGNQQANVTWLGHSTVLLELDGKTLLLDPMFSQAPSPIPQLGGRRYSEKLPIEIEELPQIDAILISHDHYDHMDYNSIKKLKAKTKHFYVPLGAGSHLERWGVEPKQIRELDWWNEAEFEGLTIACTPARHFSGRSLFDRDSTLWCSWVIAGQQTKVYFSGDSGYGPHFKEIGERFGPFDLTLLECGQYDQRWSAIHMMPEETVQAQLDLKGKMMLPIHWGAFTLALHDWNEPIERVTKTAKAQNIEIASPRIGETFMIGAANYPASIWWSNKTAEEFAAKAANSAKLVKP